MPISLGPKLGFINNASIGETYYDQERQFLQGIDAIVQMSVISTSINVPPTNPNNGDAYLLITGTPSGVWASFAGYVAVWNTQVTTSGTNTQVPQWVFYKPQAGWITWVTGSISLLVYDGVTWDPIVAGGVKGEIPAGAINGTNLTFLLTFSPAPADSLSLYVNGIFQIPTVDYNTDGTVIDMSVPPSSGSTIFAVYDYA